MAYYPINLYIKGLKCLIAGGGTVAERKIFALVAREAQVKVVSPHLTKRLKNLAEEGKIEYISRNFQIEDLNDVSLVIGATNQPEINSLISKKAKEKGILVNIVDSPELSNFIVPSTLRRGSLSISITTEGKSPALAKKIRKQLEESFSKDYSQWVELLGNLRTEVKNKVKHPWQREKIWDELTQPEILELIESKDWEKVKERVERCISFYLE